MQVLLTSGTPGQLRLGYVGHPLEVVVAGVTEVGRAETEEHSHRAAVPAKIENQNDLYLFTFLCFNTYKYYTH